MNYLKHQPTFALLLSALQNLASAFLILLSLLLLLPEQHHNPTSSAPLSLDERILRLHILAAGDDTGSQEIKLHVRDAILAQIQTAAAAATTANEAEQILSPLLSEIVATANQVLEDSGASYRASAAITTEFFPIKQYGSLLLPPGEYRALRIVLGEGEGKNWWCMLYPSLCFTEGITAAITEEEKGNLQGLLTEEEYDLLFSKESAKPLFRFRIVELWEKIKEWF